MTTLVTGATGRVGRHVVDGLRAGGEPVRAVTRSPATAGLPADVEVFEGDLLKPETLRDAFAEVDKLYLFPEPETADAVAGLAAAAGVRHVVVLSSSSVLDEGNFSGQHHLAVENAVAQAGLQWTFVRPDEFATNILWKWGESIRRDGVVRAPYANAARALIHEADVGAVAALALLEDGHAGQAYELTGPESLTQAEQVRIVGEGIGLPVRFEEVTPEQAKEGMRGAMPDPVIDMVLDYLRANVDRPGPVLSTVEDLTGRPPRTLLEWATDHKDELHP